MSFTLHYHPLASYAMKVTLGLYELGLEFEKKTINLMDPAERAEYLKLTPIGKLPALRDDTTGRVYLETSVILEAMGADRLIPKDRDQALECRYLDRVFDLYVADQTAKIVTDKLRPAGQHDPFGVDEARKKLATTYDLLDARLEGRRFAVGDDFTLADCAASPALFYADKIRTLRDRPRLTAYFQRLLERPAFARVLREAEPFMKYFPG
jgi:glutathione S-transferase